MFTFKRKIQNTKYPILYTKYSIPHTKYKILGTKYHILGFTLIELLVVIAILALLMSIIVITLNPAEMLRKSRDVKRISQLQSINSAIGMFQANKPNTSTGTASIVYVSIPDSSSTCVNLSLPTLPDTYTYQCSTSDNYRKTDGTGWIPINFNSLDIGSPLSTLPIDPTNATTSGLYYTYSTGGSWELTSTFESSTYRLSGDTDKASTDGGDNVSLYEQGNDLTLNPLRDTGLVGYWRFDGIIGSSISNNSTTALEDSSGNNNNGTAKNSNGTGMSFVQGKNGGAVSFDGTDDYVDCGTNASVMPDAFSVSAWIKTVKAQFNPILSWNNSFPALYAPYYDSSSHRSILFLGNSNYKYFSNSPTNLIDNNWHHVVFVITGNTQADVSSSKLYVDGIEQTANAITNTDVSSAKVFCKIGWYPSGVFGDLMDDVRIYNRALFVAEIKAIYNGSR